MGENSVQGTALGFDAVVSDNSVNGTAIGTRSLIGENSSYSTALGNHSLIGANSRESTAVGQAAKVGTNSSGSVAVGHGAKVADDTQRGVAIGDRAETSHSNSVALGGQSATVAGAETNYSAYGLDAPQSSVGEIGVGTKAGGTRTITGVAAGSRDTDAVNVSQLRGVDERLSGEIDDLDTRVTQNESDIVDLDGRVTQNEDDIERIDNFAVKYDPSASDPSQPDYQSITLGQGAVGAAPVLIDNVRAGKIAANSYQAVNGSQIYYMSSSVADALGGGSTVNPDGTISAPTYTIQGSSYNNVGDAFAGVDSALDQINDELTSLNRGVGDAKKEARQAAAVGLAAASLRYDDRPGAISVAAGGGYWRDQGAFSFGAGYTSENQFIRANVNAASTGKHWGVGAGLTFTLN